MTLPPFRQLSHDVQSGPIEVENNNIIHIRNLYYDGKAEEAYFSVGTDKPSSNGTLVPNEFGTMQPLSLYHDKNVTIKLPRNITIADIDYLAIWDVNLKISFGHVFMNERYIEVGGKMRVSHFKYCVLIQ